MSVPELITTYYDNNDDYTDFIKEEYYLIDGKKSFTYKLYYEPPLNHILKQSCYYINDLIEGEEINYYSDGHIFCKNNYVNGKKNGPSKVYQRITPDNSEPYFKEIIINYIDDKIDGPLVKYYCDGNIDYEGFFIKGKAHGICKHYDIYGRLWIVYNCIYGNHEGEYIEYGYNNDQQIIIEKSYFVNSKLHGECKTFNIDGTIKESYNYNNGERIYKN